MDEQQEGEVLELPEGELPEVDPQVEREARSLGWTPRDKFRGDAKNWVDASEFVRRGHEVMPLLKSTNRRLEQEVTSLREALRENNESIEGLKEFQVSLLKDKLASQRTNLLAQIRSAKEDGNIDLEVALGEQLSEVRTAEREAKEAPKPKPATQQAAPNPDFDAWKATNTWFGENRRKTALALGIAAELKEANPSLQGQAFFDKVDEELDKELGATRRPAADKTEGGGRPSGGGGRKDAFEDLPSDAKAQARSDAKQFVGPNKAFKTEKEWFAHFTKLYNQE